MTKLSDAGIVIACLKEQDVDAVFGYPGGAILNTYGIPCKHRDEIHHALASHERDIVYAAGGYTHASGEVGMCLATSGPGATNLVIGIASAYMDSSPIVAIVYNAANPVPGGDSFREIDIAGISTPVTEYNFTIKDMWELAGVLRRVSRIVRSDRLGSMLADIIENVTVAITDYETVLPVVEALRPLPTEEKIEEAFTSLKAAKEPCIMTGGGVILSSAAETPTALAHCLDILARCILMDQGVFNQSSPLYTGMVDTHGTRTSNYTVSDCDLFVMVGAHLSDRVTGSPEQFAAKARILQIDIDEVKVSKNIHIAAPLVDDATVLSTCLTEKLSA